MRIAISAIQPSLDGDVDPRFGRCQYFIIVDPETMEFEALENPNVGAMGAGIATAQFVTNKGAEAIITGSLGPNAYRALAAAKIMMFTGITGKIRDALQAYNSGKLRATQQATVGPYFGMGRGMGMQRGMGRGPGFVPGMGPGGGPMPQTVPPSSPSREEEIANLKNRAQTLAQDLAEIQRRIEELEKQKE
jgi:predicted Fe-Mo cluster-binding NifX family protein